MPDMYFKQMLHEDCGCSSYVVGGRSTNEVAVIDPALDISEVLDLVRLRGFTVRHIIDTHIHADHISGARRWPSHRRPGVPTRVGGRAHHPFTPLRDGDELTLGNVSLRVLHPGHRPKSVTLLVTNHARGEAPSMAVTGDTLLVGDVGRPDSARRRGRAGAVGQRAAVDGAGRLR
ncbi:MAG: MBL fold metallo-hydrolase [Dehalococcoidia bacterium]